MDRISEIMQAMEKLDGKNVSIDRLLLFCSEYGCSDLYIKTGEVPYINCCGKVYSMPCRKINILTWNEFSNAAIDSDRDAEYARRRMLDFPYELSVPPESRFAAKCKKFRYRVSAGFSQNFNTATFRMVSPELPSFSSIKVPAQIRKVLQIAFGQPGGITVLSGATGSGKTTTLAACINDFRKAGSVLENGMLITLEDPIEYEFNSTSDLRIMQKELGRDFIGYPEAVKQALREHPTCIMLGEIRDRQGITTCIEAARTGHSVYTTFHATDVAGSVSRLYNYVAGTNDEIMFDLIANLNLILCQRLSANSQSIDLETQYILFSDNIKKRLREMIMQNRDITSSINMLFEDSQLLEKHLLKDWS